MKFLKWKAVSKFNVIFRDLPMVIPYVTICRHKVKVKHLKTLKGEEVDSEELLYILDITGH